MIISRGHQLVISLGHELAISLGHEMAISAGHQLARQRKVEARHGGKARPLRGQGTGVVGGKARTAFQKICPSGKFFEMIFKKNSEILRPSLRPDRPQFYIQFDLNFTSNSISILRPIRLQFYVQFDLNFTSNSTSILHPDRSQWATFFLLRVRSWGDMKLPLAIVEEI